MAVFLTGLVFVVAGTLHFLFPAQYLKIMPPALPAPALLVVVSGMAEIAGGVGLWIPSLRLAAAWGLILLLIAVFPANIYMAWAHVPFGGIAGQSWAQWARLPLQFVMIWWIYSVRHLRPSRVSSSSDSFGPQAPAP